MNRTATGAGGMGLATARILGRDHRVVIADVNQVNESARRFYERHDFVAAEYTDGHGNEEREPDVRYVWRPGKHEQR